MTDLLVVAHGKLQSGSAGRRWAAAEARLRLIFGNRVEIRFTARRGDGTQVAREALLSGVRWLAAAGGDGTINETVNGFFAEGRNIRPDAALSLLPCGSSNDYARIFGIPTDLCLAVEAFQRSEIHKVDVGLARFLSIDGNHEQRVFVNVAEAGVGGALVARQDGWLLRSRIRYRIASLAAALSCKPFQLQLAVDGTAFAVPTPVLTLIVAGGRYFGNGMHCAPMARPDDGLLEVITVGDFGPAEIMAKIGTFFTGSYLKDPKVTHHTARIIEAHCTETVYLQLDGEMVGILPAEFAVLPASLQLRY